MYKKLLGFVSVGVILGFLLPTLALADGNVQILTINGQDLNGGPLPCIAGPISITGDGITGQQGGTWHVDVNWGDGVINPVVITSGTLGGKNSVFAFSASHTPVGSSTGLTLTLYHSQPSGEDGKVIIINQCVAPPTTAVLTVKKHVENDNLFPGTAVASDFMIHVKNGSNEVPNGGNGVFSPTTGSETGKDFIITPAAGNYVLSEDAFSGYTQKSIVCANTSDNISLPGTGFPLTVGKNYLCTITNNDDVVKVTPTLSVTNSPVTYNGSAQAAAVSGSVSGVVTDVKYGGSSTVPTNAGTYAITADFAPTDAVNYNSLNDASAGNFVINKADSTTTVTCSDVTYTGSAQTPCMASVTGAGGLSLNPTPIYTDNTNAGTGHASYTYAGDANHNGSSDSDTFTISKADAATITVTPYAVTYNGNSHTATATAFGILGEDLSSLFDLSGTTHTDAGSYIDGWSFAGNDNYNSATGDVDDEIAKADQTITFTVGDHIFGDADFAISATATSGLPVSFAVVSGDCELVGNTTVHITGAGDCKIVATQGGNENYNPAPDVTRTFNIDKADQAITFDPLADMTYGDADFTVSATADSGLDVTFSAAGDCTVTGTTVHITGAGSCTITASQEGNDDYNPASDVEQTFTINKSTAVTITVTPYSVTYDGIAHTATASATGFFGEDLSSLFDLTGTTHTDAGSYSDTWIFNGNDNYESATDVVTDEIAKADQTITFDPLTDKVMGDADFDVAATATSGLPVTFTVGDGSTCTISGTTVHLTGVGSCTIIANQDGDDNYNAADPVSQTFTIATLLHTITASAGTHGAISPLGFVTVADGTDQSFTMTSDSGYHIADVLVDGSSVGAVSTYNFTAVTADHTIAVSFEIDAAKPACSDGIDNDNDNKTDYSDPGCHTDGNVNNEGSYNPNGNSEVDPVMPECSDGIDNDGDHKTDIQDPGCHTDGKANNPDSYDPSDNKEKTGGQSTSGGGHWSGGGSPAGEVLGASNICGVYLDKYLRMGSDNNPVAVEALQKFLNQFMNAGLTVDGKFGGLTDKFVRLFQTAHADKILTPWGLPANKPTGIVYLTTTTEINNIMCPELQLPIPTNLVPWGKQ